MSSAHFFIGLFIFGVSFINSFFNVYLFLRERDREGERESASGEGAERKGDRSEAGWGSELSAEPDVGLKLTNCETMT